jgi:nicotinamide riboside transporter PnuC
VIPVWWSVLLTAVGVLGIWLAGQRNSWGWAVGLGAQVLWIAYAVATRQWGFIGSAAAYGFVYARALYRWRRDERAMQAVGR